MPGTVVTFYSYKGGVGRSLALAWVAWILASAGKKVLVVDWDLEAPGLENYFWPAAAVKGMRTRAGLVDLVIDYRDRLDADALARYLERHSWQPLAAHPDWSGEDWADPSTAEQARAELADPDLREWVRERITRVDLDAARAELTRDSSGGEADSDPMKQRLRDCTSWASFVEELDIDDVFQPGGSVDLMRSGRLDAEYAAKLALLDWNELYTKFAGHRFFRTLKSRWADYYDFVLVDSRTGMGDVSATCTQVLPDVMVACFGMNEQGILNTARVAAQARAAGARERRELRILPLPSRIETSARAAAGKAKDRYQRVFELPWEEFEEVSTTLPRQPLIGPRILGGTQKYWEQVALPHTPRYAFQEGPPHGIDRDRLQRACEFLAQNIGRDDTIRLNPPSRTAWAKMVAGFDRPARKLQYDEFVISYAEGGRDPLWAAWVYEQLCRISARVRQHNASRDGTGFLDDRLRDAGGDPGTDIDGGKLCVLILLSPRYVESEFGRATWRWAASRYTRADPADRGSSRWSLLPVLISSHAPETAPFAEIQPVSLVKLDEETARTTLLAELADTWDERESAVLTPVEFPGSPEDLVRRYQERADELERANAVTAERVATLRQLAQEKLEHHGTTSTSQAVQHLREANRLARDRRDSLVAALTGFELAYAEFSEEQLPQRRRTGRPRQTAVRAVEETMRLVDSDTIADLSDATDIRGAIDPNNSRGGIHARSTLTSSRLYRNDLRPLRRAIDEVDRLGLIEPLSPDGQRLRLAKAVVLRLLDDVQEARPLLVEVHQNAGRDRALRARCDLEIGMGSFARGRTFWDDAYRKLLRLVQQPDVEARIRFLALSTLGAMAKPEEARGHFERALEAVAGERHLAGLRIAALVNLGRNAAARGLHPTEEGGPLKHFEEAVDAARGEWPLVSLPLAEAYWQTSRPVKSPHTSKEILARLLRAIWIYTVLGLQAEVHECRKIIGSRAAKDMGWDSFKEINDGEPTSTFTPAKISDFDVIMAILDVRVPDTTALR